MKDFDKVDYNKIADDINIPQLLAEKYPQWIFLTPEVYQISSDGKTILKTWNNKKEIVEFYHKRIQGLDLALRKRCRFIGYYWVLKVLYDYEGIRPILTEKRNTPIYAYDVPDYIWEHYEDYTHEDMQKDEIRRECRFLGRFANSVLVGDYLQISVTNIRRVAKKENGILLHKGYYFSFDPFFLIHKLSSDILVLLEKKVKYELSEDEVKILRQLFVDFEQEYNRWIKIEHYQILSNIEEKVKKLVDKYKEII